MIEVLFNILVALGCLLMGYLLGGIPSGVIIGKVFFKKDPRDYGSGASGATNVGRLFGKKVGFICILCDILKTIIPLWACWAIIRFSGIDNPDLVGFRLFDHGILYYYLSIIGVALGHCWPIYVGFRGGKAVTSLMAITFSASWLQVLNGFIYLGTLKKTKIVSLTAIVIAIAMSVSAWAMGIITFIFGPGQSAVNGTLGTWAFGGNMFLWGFGSIFEMGYGWEYPLVMTIMSIIVIYRHKDNIKRMKDGSERKITWMK